MMETGRGGLGYELRSTRPPHLARQLHDQRQLRLLRLRRDRVAFRDAREAALRADREAVEVHIAARVVEAALSRVLLFDLRRLGRDGTERDALLLPDLPQRGEATRPRPVAFPPDERDAVLVEQLVRYPV